MLIPLAHERSTVRKLPWITLVFAVACVLTSISLNVRSTAQEETGITRAAALDYYLRHPGLRPDPRLVPEQATETVRDVLRVSGDAEGPDANLSQKRLDELTATWLASLERNPVWRYGLVPAEPHGWSYITYIFLHGGWGHLLGNLLFLYFTGPFVEERFGHLGFLLFFLAGGALAGLAFCLHYPQMFQPLIGASGAIAGSMGAFLVLFGNTRIRFLVFLWVIPRTFTAPAWLMLPLWFLADLYSALGSSRADPSGFFSSTAYWSHVWGFVFGVAVAAVVALATRSDPDAEVADLAVSSSASTALRALGKGRREEAWGLLQADVRRRDADLEATELFWELSMDLRRGHQAVPAAVRLVKNHLRRGEVDEAMVRWRQLEGVAPEAAKQVGLTAPLAAALLERGDSYDGSEMLRLAADEASADAPIGALRTLHRLAVRRDDDLRRRIAGWIRSHPHATPEMRDEVSGELFLAEG